MSGQVFVGVLIGGVANGRRIKLRDSRQDYELAELPMTQPITHNTSAPIKCNVMRYRYEVFFGEGHNLFLKPTGMPYDAAIRELFNGYRHEVL